VVRRLGSEAESEAALNQLRFQLEALRYSPAGMSQHLPQLAGRARHYLGALYTLLLKPLEPKLGTRRLVVVPHRSLHYVPFHALHDGQGYVIERRAVSYAPSAGVLRHCFARPVRAWQRAVLLGMPDVHIPRVREEVGALAPLFPEAVTLLEAQATLTALQAQAPTADVIHLACHGLFRPDNPLFSALRFADGWLTVQDAYGLDLRQCGLVVLSACETGVSALAPGDDLIGLARGFFSAGAPSLVVSLWTVDDETTAQLMGHFYTRLRAGDGPAAALRLAQCRLLEQRPHPFFWSPFMLLGRW
jgi:CHAT domain-containing protein